MDTLLAGGDHSRDMRGIPVRLTGDRELIQRALLRLSVRKGSFAFDPGLGSELYKLAQARAPGDMERLALSYAQEALLPMPQVSVGAVALSRGAGGAYQLTVTLKINENQYALEVAYDV